MLHCALTPVVLPFPLSLPTFGLVSIVQLIVSNASDSVSVTLTVVVDVLTPVVPFPGLFASVVILSLAVKVYHSLVQSVPSDALMYHV